MSADNGVYVLYTEHDSGSQYRVAYAANIDDIFGEHDDTTGWQGDDHKIVETFADKEAFTNLEEALNHADEVAATHDYLEYGVCIISDFQDRGYLFE